MRPFWKGLPICSGVGGGRGSRAAAAAHCKERSARGSQLSSEHVLSLPLREVVAGMIAGTAACPAQQGENSPPGSHPVPARYCLSGEGRTASRCCGP